MRKAITLLCLLIGMSWASAQTKITGTVVSADDGQPVIGATVLVKGTSAGTITDANGLFSITLPSSGKKLMISYVGMTTTEVDAKSGVKVVLQTDSKQMNEVVVTALGISREKKSLGYAVQKVDGDELNAVKSSNFVTGLSGKVSGIQIKNTTNFGGSTNVLVRGATSLTQSNQALFVVDGIPVDNSNTNNSGQLTGRNGYDYGNAAADINPNDIESVSVLKGAAATALYGSRAASGVILITTKKGKAGKKVDIKLSSNVTLSSIDKATMPSYQTEYGAGYGPYYGSTGYFDEDSKGNLYVPFYEDASRGGKFDASQMVYQWDSFYPESPNFGKKTPYVMTQNGPDTFFKTGVSKTNSVDISGGSDATTYRFSYSNMDQSGNMPNSVIKKNSALFTGSQDLAKNVKLTTSANYVNTYGKGRPSTGYNDNIMTSFRQWYQVNADMNMMKYLYDATGTNATWNRKSAKNAQPAYWDSPYWIRYQNFEEDNRDRLIGYAKLDWKINDAFNVMGRYSVDTYSELQQERKAVGSVAGEFGVGRPDVTSGYSRFQKTYTETNLDFLLNFHKRLSDALDVSALLGTNIRRNKADQVFASTNNGLAVAGIYALSNSLDPMLPPEEIYQRIGINGIFASASLGYKSTLFLDATLRRDQSSTLPKANNAYYYPSVTTSFIFSNVLKTDWLSFGKVRLNFAEVGNSAPAMRDKDTYTIVASFSGNTMATVPNTKYNPNLKPERQRAVEAGLEMNFFKSRVGFDFAYYKNNTFDQLMPVSTSYATGYSAKWVNAGELQNKGVELSLFATPVKTKNFKWDVKVNWAQNKSKVISLFTDESGNEVSNLQIGSLQGGVTVNARVGEAYGAICGSDYVYSPDGQKVVKSNGRYQISSSNDNVIGNVNPDWTGGISNTFTYKNLSLSFLIDVQKGGDIFSLDMWYGISTGLYKETAGLNDLGNPKRDAIAWADANDHSKGYASTSGGTINPGVVKNSNGTYSPNTTRINNQTYAADGYAVSPNKRFVYDASFVKLRELTLTYTFPKSLLSKTFINGASLSFVGSNLWIIHKNLPYADPESSQSSGNIQGWQCGVLPATRNFGFTANVQF